MLIIICGTQLSAVMNILSSSYRRYGGLQHFLLLHSLDSIPGYVQSALFLKCIYVTLG